MSEASQAMIDGMMERLGETAGLVAGDQKGETVLPTGPKGVNPGSPLVAVDLFLEADRGVDNGLRSSTVIGVWD